MLALGRDLGLVSRSWRSTLRVGVPSVLAGLIRTPVVAVPTSVGYGASFEGIGPLLTMLNACAPGVAVVNIDNGFGAGYMAASITKKIRRNNPVG